MPVVTIREAEYTPATFNTEKISARALELFTANFGAAARDQDPGGDGRRGFQPLLAGRQVDRKPDLLGRRHAQAGVGRGRRQPGRSSPRSTSPFWAPDAEAVISTATEAMTVAALDVLKKG